MVLSSASKFQWRYLSSSHKIHTHIYIYIYSISNTIYIFPDIYFILYILQLYLLDQKGYYMRKANNFCVFPTMFPTKIFKFKPPPHQWRLQEFYPGCSYSTLKKFRVISGRFGKYWLKFKIWPAWSLC